MKKKFLLPLLGLFALPAVAQTTFTYEYQGQTVTYQVLDEDSKTASTVVGTSSGFTNNSNLVGEIILPETVQYNGQDYTLTQIGDYSFQVGEEITSISIPKTVTSIGTQAFAWCDNLTSVYNYATPQTISGEYVFFNDDENLTEQITLYVAENALPEFENWGGYTWKAIEPIQGYNVEYPEIENGVIFNYDGINYTVEDATALTCITTPNNGSDYPQGSSISGDIVIPEQVRYNGQYLTVVGVGEQSFYFADYYGDSWTITLPSTIEFIGEYAFEYCNSLTSVKVEGPSNLKTIGNYAFITEGYYGDKSGLEYLEIDATSLTDIGAEICYGDSNLKSIIFTGTPGDGVELTLQDGSGSYDGRQFYNLTSLESLVLPTSLKNLSYYCINACGITPELVIPRNVTSINKYGIRNCNELITLSFPASLTEFTSSGLRSADKLENLYEFATVPPTLNDGIAFSTSYINSLNINLFVPRQGVEAYKANEDWNELGIATNGAGSLGWKTISEITWIDEGFTYVVLNDTDATLESSMPSVEMILPETIEIYTNILKLTEISEGAIDGQNLLSLTVESVNPPTASGAFSNLNANAVLYVPAEAVEAYQAAEGWKEFSRIRPIGYVAPSVDDAFELLPANNTDVTELETITVSSNVFTNLQGVGTSVNVNNEPATVTTTTDEDGNLLITLASPVTTVGDCTVVLPAGLFTYTDDIYTVESPELTLNVNVVAKTVKVEFTFTATADPEFVTAVTLDGETVKDWAEGFEAAAGQELSITLDMTYNVESVTLNGESIVDDIVAVDNVGTYTLTVGSEDLAFNFDATSGVKALNSSVLENAEFYNLNGVRVNSSNLTPGVYVVRNGEKTTKVVIR